MDLVRYRGWAGGSGLTWVEGRRWPNSPNLDDVWSNGRLTGELERFLVLPTSELDEEEDYEDRKRSLRYEATASSFERDLYLRFAELADEEEIRAFAESYGFLRDPEPMLFQTRQVKAPCSGQGESLSFWEQEIAILRYAIRLRNAVRWGEFDTLPPMALPAERESQRTLNGLLLLEEGPAATTLESGETVASPFVTCVTARPNLEGVDWGGSIPRVFAGSSRETMNPSRTAWSILAKLIERYVYDFCRLEMTIPTGDAIPQEFIRSANLLGALWLQFRTAVTGDHRLRRCSGCGKWFSLEGRRPDAHYCEGGCRVRALRSRSRDAKELSVRGLSPSEVAARLSTEWHVVSEEDVRRLVAR